MGPLWLINILISLMIVTGLLYSLRNYLLTRKYARTKFTNALVALTSVFLIQHLYAAYVFYMMSVSYSEEMHIATPLLMLNVIGFAGFTIFIYLSRT
ncbi:hypothetical protein CSUB_C0177 [Candidatus Caldarchaeum subterraneum]|uniref:Uncharacterized protein n=2 Tax=Thermoproteati TaxID=1783275 RepID=H5SJ45_9CREN|nr:hypothetical protein HGMM_F15C07C42 [Candidatus Caldarchaeum subterraneum]BAJ50038.1 hypothetical protein CSUB_C0177 [Candidatus Caldarchaeum subterraneum]BAL56181.1 hypothetical protein HGMM_F34F09C36 [uncultured crenarchaeote]